MKTWNEFLEQKKRSELERSIIRKSLKLYGNRPAKLPPIPFPQKDRSDYEKAVWEKIIQNYKRGK
jgi:hypothetical protein